MLKIEKKSGRLIVRILGIKFKFKMKQSFNILGHRKEKIDSNGNIIFLGSRNIEIRSKICGQNNKIYIEAPEDFVDITIVINGNNNEIIIKNAHTIRDFSVSCGNPGSIANNTLLNIEKGVSIESGEIMLFNSDNKCIIGEDCMISSGVKIRCGELPHLIKDLNTNENLDISEGVFIGNHVWIGEGAWIMKKCTIPNGCIVGSASVVTKRFQDENAVIAGNPAKIVRSNIRWDRNANYLE